MDCGEQCVVLAGITMMPELCADNWGTTQVEVSSLGKRLMCLGIGVIYLQYSAGIDELFRYSKKSSSRMSLCMS